jgi:hypothetical protein
MHEETILEYFKYDHLPAHLQQVSKIFADAAAMILVVSPNPSAERTVALYKLLESRDHAVRSVL